MQAAADPGWDKLKHKNVAHTSVSVVKHMQLLSLSQIFALTEKYVPKTRHFGQIPPIHFYKGLGTFKLN